MAFTRLDRNLLLRVSKHLQTAAGAADALVNRHREAGQLTLAARSKSDADRLHRDLRDVDQLRRRLEVAYPQSMKAPAPVEPAPTEA